MNFALYLSLAALGIWIYLLVFRGMFWLARERDGSDNRDPAAWPSVAVIVPARDEEGVVVHSIGSLLAQDYPGTFHIVFVDDQSTDGTVDAVRALDTSGRLEVLNGVDPPAGWTGKLWALKQGTVHASERLPDFYWFTDADIAHRPDNLKRLVARAEEGRLVMVSLMAKLRCESLAEQFLIPAFVFFFEMLFPFAWVNRQGNPMAAAAGGCILLRRKALERAGGIDSVRGEIIDDCALGRRMKAQGNIWLGLTERAVSLRPYLELGAIRRMIARSAYAQLGYSPLLLAGTIAFMIATYAAPPLVTLFGAGESRLAASLAWASMALAFQPMLRFYRRSPLWGFALPLIGIFYVAFTMDSAIQFWRGRGGMWKDRLQAMNRV